MAVPGAEPLDVIVGSMDTMRRGIWTRSHAVELIAGAGAAGLGAKVPGLAEIGGVELRGRLLNVFGIGCGRIIAVEDYEEALAAAGAKAPQWA